MAAPRQMTANSLNALKGWPQMNAVDYHAAFDSSIPSGDLPVLAGSVVSLNSSGNPDVVNDGGDASTTAGVWVPITPTGQALALVAVGAYELVSTAYVSGSYPPNTALTANKSGSAAPGKLRSGTLYTNMIVGIVSRGVVDNGYGKNALAFWPCPVFPN
jgi:hypothetical protein